MHTGLSECVQFFVELVTCENMNLIIAHFQFDQIFSQELQLENSYTDHF